MRLLHPVYPGGDLCVLHQEPRPFILNTSLFVGYVGLLKFVLTALFSPVRLAGRVPNLLTEVAYFVGYPDDYYRGPHPIFNMCGCPQFSM